MVLSRAQGLEPSSVGAVAQHSSLHVVLLCLIVLALASCGGNYQAPVSEQGESLPVNRPEIIDDSGNDEPQRVVERSRSSNGAVAQVRGGVGGLVDSARGLFAGGGNTRAVQNTTSAGSTASLNPESYQVRRGDSLYSIAFQFDLDYRDLAAANGLRPPYTIFVGQQLNLRAAASNGSPAITAGTPVADSGIARTRGSNRSSGVSRQPIGGIRNTAPSWRWPHSGELIERYGQSDNKGVDISGLLGDPVFAAGDGEVVYAGQGVQGAGNLIIVRHSERFLSAYAHNQALLVQQGAQVVAGQQLAELGADGNGTPKLHFEIRLDGKSVDPQEFLPAR